MYIFERKKGEYWINNDKKEENIEIQLKTRMTGKFEFEIRKWWVVKAYRL